MTYEKNTHDLASALRILSIDAVEAAQSGHPGMPLGMADIATVLWRQFLRHQPLNPLWFNRDRFVLSNGHGSMLLYSLLHLTGYALGIDDLKQFRQLGSKTPGHPEFGHAPGVETTTGPLGQGLANAVGMAIAERHLAAVFNKPNLPIVDHFTYAFVGDGCLMEGISHEVCSLAGTLGLGKLIVFYDDNGISIDGEVDGWFLDDTAERFRAYHWQVIEGVDGHDAKAIEEAIIKAKMHLDAPTLIMCNTIIGKFSPVAGSERSHGAPLGADGVAFVRDALNWKHEPFVIPEAIKKEWDQTSRGQALEQEWLMMCQQYQKDYPDLYQELMRRANGDLPDDWQELSDSLYHLAKEQQKPMATRKASQFCIEYYASKLPEMLGGSADLTGSNNTDWSGSHMMSRDMPSGNYIGYGVREFGMAAIMNGLALHGGVIPYGGTFLVFSDYARNAIRLSALMKQRVIYVLTHDSIGLGEDGPTHQPVEHAAMLRLTPNLMVWRPADVVETAIAWTMALETHDAPSALLLSRQNLTPLPIVSHTHDDIKRGGYILFEPDKTPDAILMATGSEVMLAVTAAKMAHEQGVAVRVVSMPCVELFLMQDDAWQEKVLPNHIRRRVAIEAASTGFWYRFVGLDGAVIGLDDFGVSAKASDAYEHFNITVNEILIKLHSLGCAVRVEK